MSAWAQAAVQRLETFISTAYQRRICEFGMTDLVFLYMEE